MNNLTKIALAFAALLIYTSTEVKGEDAVHMANGVKIGEVTAETAIIWTRLTTTPERNVKGRPFPKNVNKARKSSPVADLAAMEGAVPGGRGEVRITYWTANQDKRVSTQWKAVDPDGNYTRQFRLTGLLPGTHYQLLAEGRPSSDSNPTCQVEGEFTTAQAAKSPSPVSFTVVTGQDYPRRDDRKNGHRIYPLMKKLKPSFFVHTGDIEYYDKPDPYADNVELARFKWNRLYSMPFQRDFHNRTASYFIKDDHDTLKNDCWPGQKYGDLTWEQGLALFPEQVPMGDTTYRTIRWGKDLQIWLVEGRDFRSPNKLPDGPDKTILGKAQKAWFFETVNQSDATFRVLISPTPVVGPDRGNKNDNHANKGFTHEGNELRKFISAQKNMYIVCGDRHWQYVSVDPVTGVREYSCGPTTDKHASGFSEKNRSEMHQYLRVIGGFLRVAVEYEQGKPRIRFQHYNTKGEVVNDDVFQPKG